MFDLICSYVNHQLRTTVNWKSFSLVHEIYSCKLRFRQFSILSLQSMWLYLIGSQNIYESKSATLKKALRLLVYQPFKNLTDFGFIKNLTNKTVIFSHIDKCKQEVHYLSQVGKRAELAMFGDSVKPAVRALANERTKF